MGGSTTYTISPAPPEWKDDPGLGLLAGEAFRCTTLLSSLAKPALVGWAMREEAKAYQAAIRQVFLDRPALVSGFPIASYNTDDGKIDGWLDDFGIQVATARKAIGASERKSAEARDIGTQAHAWVEWFIRCKLDKKKPPPPEPGCEGPVALIVAGFQAWALAEDFLPAYAEETVWSELDRWAGTVDLIGRIGPGVRCKRPLVVIDIKSSAGIYLEQKMQVAAYCVGAHEQGLTPELPKGIILRLPKSEDNLRETIEKNGVPYEVRIIEGEEVIEHYQAFLAAKQLYETTRRITRAEKENH